MGLIICADDARVTLETLKLELENLGVADRSEFYLNGQEVIDRVSAVLSEALNQNRNLTASPVHCIILDF
jgi:CheY-like chemotaxis protein